MNAKKIIISGFCLAFLGIGLGVWILSDSYSRLNRTMQRQEQETRERLSEQLDSIIRQRAGITSKIDSLEAVIERTDERISKQIEKYRNETFKNLRDYRDSSNNALLDRLRAK
jgi:DNA anti-recombination protein RmuC